VLANLYINNSVRVSWGDAMTDYFTALNEVKQGAVLSPILYYVYVDDLLLILSKAASVVLLVYPLWTHLHKLAFSFYWHQALLRYASISFNALKSKCLIALTNCRNTFKKVNDGVFYIEGRMVDHVQSFSHLSHLHDHI